ncbi:hypothetical protein [Flavobacterium sp. WC2509]|uniref:hypothetical protein n=1 Tax=Flavobacterium sp. WC2509 TaxID=3461406 RepID=UPI004043997D
MKYLISEERKAKAIKKNRVFMSLNYGVGVIIASIAILTKFNTLPIEKLFFFFGIILIAPIAWWYFDRNFRNKVNSEYEILNGKLIITENGKQKTTELQSIKKITKIPSGHRIISNNGTFYILNGVENGEELISKLEK